MNKSFVCVLSAMFLLLGVVIGFLMAPIKKGVYCGNNNGNHYFPGDGCCGGEPDEDGSEDDLPF